MWDVERQEEATVKALAQSTIAATGDAASASASGGASGGADAVPSADANTSSISIAGDESIQAVATTTTVAMDEGTATSTSTTTVTEESTTAAVACASLEPTNSRSSSSSSSGISVATTVSPNPSKVLDMVNVISPTGYYIWPEFILDLLNHPRDWASWRKRAERGLGGSTTSKGTLAHIVMLITCF